MPSFIDTYTAPFKIDSLECNTIKPATLQSSKYFKHALFGRAMSSLSDFCFMSSTVTKCCLFMETITIGRRKDHAGTHLAKFLKSNDVRPGTLLVCNFYKLFFHKSGFFLLIASYKWRKLSE